ncbi:MAG: MFS transporter [Hyphomonadaceae bacterium]
MTASGQAEAPGLGKAWFAVVLLVLLYCMSFIDRLVLSLLASQVSASLHISDTALGVLYGVGFGVVYSLIGLPLAHMIDNHNRVRLVIAGVVLWSACTLLSAFADTFMHLLLLRTGVAIGEAVLSPAAISLIADFFPRDKRTAPTTVYNAVSSYMGSGAFVIGAGALDIATRYTAATGMEPWRFTLVLVGAPGLILALIFALGVREPPRHQEAAAAEQGKDFKSVGQALSYVRKEAGLYGCLFVCAAALTTIGFAASAWAPTLLVRAHGMTPAQSGYFYGTVGMIAAVCGAAVWPAAMRYWMKKGRLDALPTIMSVTVTISWLAIATIGCAKADWIVLVAAGLNGFFGVASGVLIPLIIQYVTPGRMRARIMALYLLANNLIGFAVGPPLAAFISENFYSGPFAIGYGFTTVALIFGPIGTIAVWRMRKYYARALAEVQRTEAQAAGAA